MRSLPRALNAASTYGPRPDRLAGGVGAAASAVATAALWIVLAAVLAGCATAGGGLPDAAEETGPASVEVKNQNWQDMHIYVMAAGQRWSLGLVTSQSTRTYELPDGVFATGRRVIFLADPVGSVLAFHSDPLHLERGDRVEWMLQNQLVHSSIHVF